VEISAVAVRPVHGPNSFHSVHRILCL